MVTEVERKGGSDDSSECSEGSDDRNLEGAESNISAINGEKSEYKRVQAY
jgi:hypothetical protein